ncbi:MAG: winged helix-turn-helix transcriptional regulator [Candidatus Helarchaeota archaeon]|nr:winged helix-turn-helix transcriptional regulator [Candidatus Helarchaeota archaeon]
MESNEKSVVKDKQIENEMLITDPSTVPVLFHEKKQMILKLLIDKEMTIIDLKNETKMNPGTIKRHLENLIEKNLVIQSRTAKSEHGITMKYYRATANQFNVKLLWPIKEKS